MAETNSKDTPYYSESTKSKITCTTKLLKNEEYSRKVIEDAIIQKRCLLKRPNEVEGGKQREEQRENDINLSRILSSHHQ